MTIFTKQERMVLLVAGVVLCLGSTMRILFKQYPELVDIVNLMDSPRLYPKVNINTADAAELEAIPYIGRYTAGEIIAYRRDHGPFVKVEDIKKVRGIRDKNYGHFKNYIEIR